MSSSSLLWLTTAVLLLLLVPLAQAQQTSCLNATAAFGFFLSTGVGCADNASSSPICSQLSRDAFYSPSRTNLLVIIEPYLAAQGLSWLLPAVDVDLMLTAQLNGAASSASRASNPGEIAYVLTKIVSGWAKLLPNKTSTVPMSVFWSVWTSEWSKAAMRVTISDSWAYLRVANYFFIAAQPYPLTAAAQKALMLAYDYVFMHLDASSDKLSYVNVSIPYTTDSGQDVLLPGIAVFPATATSVAPPQLILATSGGLDWPLPGEIVRSMYGYLDKGYAVMYYEGPGQGRTVFDPDTPLRFTPHWDGVLTAAATYARTQLPLSWDQSKGLVAASESLGGFLLTQACSLVNSSLVQGCIADPASPNMAFAIAYTAFGALIAPFSTVNPATLASVCPTCAQYGSNYFLVNSTDISEQAAFNADPLLSTLLAEDCTAGQYVFAGIMALASTEGPAKLPPTAFAWLAATFVPPSATTYQNISDLAYIVDNEPTKLAGILTEAFTILQSFYITKEQAAGTDVLMAAFGGEEDFTTQSLQFNSYTSALPKQNAAVTQFFSASTGAASHCEVGAWSILMPYYEQLFDVVAKSILS